MAGRPGGLRLADTEDVGQWPLRIAIVAAAASVLGPIAAHFGVAPPLGGFFAFVIGGVVGLLDSVAGVVACRRGAYRRGIATILLGGIPALVLIAGLVGGLGKPAINDITTDLVEPPNLLYAQGQPGNLGRDMVYPEAFKDGVRSGYPDLKPLALPEPPDEAFARALRLAQERPGWEVGFVNGSGRVFEGVATSRIFGFKDDFVVRVRPDGTGSLVDMRSKSRDGKGDLGANAERIRSFLKDLSAAK
jgi:uncharacterized protein (DUF1499 family)